VTGRRGRGRSWCSCPESPSSLQPAPSRSSPVHLLALQQRLQSHKINIIVSTNHDLSHAFGAFIINTLNKNKLGNACQFQHIFLKAT
jgi:hypothetical protein